MPGDVLHVFCLHKWNILFEHQSRTAVVQHLRLIGQKAFGQSPVGFHFGQAVIA